MLSEGPGRCRFPFLNPARAALLKAINQNHHCYCQQIAIIIVVITMIIMNIIKIIIMTCPLWLLLMSNAPDSQQREQLSPRPLAKQNCKFCHIRSGRSKTYIVLSLEQLVWVDCHFESWETQLNWYLLHPATIISWLKNILCTPLLRILKGKANISQPSKYRSVAKYWTAWRENKKCQKSKLAKNAVTSFPRSFSHPTQIIWENGEG